MEADSKAETPEAVARAYFAAVTARDLDAMATCWEPGSLDVLHGVAELRVPEEMRDWFGGLFAAFPDLSFEVLEIMTGGEKAAVRWRATGSFNGSGTFEGLLPNGRRVDVEGCDVLTVCNSLIVRNDAYLNSTGMARQLGALPPAGSLPERAMSGALNLRTRLLARVRRG